MKRLFIAAPLVQGESHTLVQHQDQWKKILPHHAQWIPAENLHITLHFLGPTKDEYMAILQNALHEVRSIPAFLLQFHTFLAFPNPTRARVGAIGGQVGNSPLSNLYYEIASRIEPLGFKVEKRVFIPHITLVRFKYPVELRELPAVEPLVVPVNSFCLFESHTLPEGSRYQILSQFPLANATHS